MLGALYRYLRDADPRYFQPMNANFGLVDELPTPVRDKRVKRERLAERALADMRNGLMRSARRRARLTRRWPSRPRQTRRCREKIADFLTHLEKERDVSPNTVKAYRRDLRELVDFLAEYYGIDSWTLARRRPTGDARLSGAAGAPRFE